MSDDCHPTPFDNRQCGSHLGNTLFLGGGGHEGLWLQRHKKRGVCRARGERKDVPGRCPRLRKRRQPTPRFHQRRHALTDYSPDEIERKHSINLGLGYAEWQDTKINLIDTPGYLDYFGDAIAGLAAADAALVVSQRDGRGRGGHREVLGSLRPAASPRVLFVSLMDKEHADFDRVFQDIKTHLTPKVVPVEIPIGDGHDFHGIINLFTGHCHFYKKGTKTGEYEWSRSPTSTRRCSSTTPRTDRGRRVHRRHAARALPGGRGDLARRVHQRR